MMHAVGAAVLDAREDSVSGRPQEILVAGPPASAIGGVATHSALLATRLPGGTFFDQWAPRHTRPALGAARMLLHGWALARWTTRLALRRPSSVHLQVSRPGIQRDRVHAAVAHALGVPIVSHIHSSGFFESDHSPADAALLAIARQSRAVIVMAHDLEQDLRARVATRIVHISNPIADLGEVGERADPAADGVSAPVRILCVGEVCRRKNQIGLARAVRVLADEGLDVHLELVGPWGDESPEFKAGCERDARCTVSGTLTGADLAAAYDRSHVVALYSLGEGQPLALLDAMARELPVVAGRVGGIADMLSCCSDNAVVSLTAPDDLVAALRAFVTDPELRRRCGSCNARWVAAHRSPAEHLSAVLDVHRMARGELSAIAPT